MEARLVFVISPPRGGSTLLQRMLAANSRVTSHAEPHLLTPLAHLGYYAQVDAAPYDHLNAAEALRGVVDSLPGGEDDYLRALRAYSDSLYAGLASQGKPGALFVDKTPAYALILPFLTKLYPAARYVVLTRHPLAVWSSYAGSFFAGDWRRAHAYNPILARYVPAIAAFLRRAAVPTLQLSYEAMVSSPRQEMERLSEFLGIAFEETMVEYGRDGGRAIRRGPGDPHTVHRHQRPVTSSLHAWAAEVRSDAAKRRLAATMVAELSDADLAAWGWPRERLFAALDGGLGQAAHRPFNRFTLQRQVFFALKAPLRFPAYRRGLRRVRYACDVLLRDKL